MKKLDYIGICPTLVVLGDREYKQEKIHFDFENLRISRQTSVNSYMWSSNTAMISTTPDDVSFVFNLDEEGDLPISKTLRVIINGMEKFRYELGDTVWVTKWKIKDLKKHLSAVGSDIKGRLTLDKLADWLKKDPYVKHDC
jgi:hypothetical protein